MPVAVNYDTQTEDLNTNLYPGAKFTGEQKSNKQKYMVEVQIDYINWEQSYICGCLNIFGLTETDPSITTFFNGEIIGNSFPFLTRKWDASFEVDEKHWSKFKDFEKYKHNFNDDDFDISQLENSPVIYMRWKEQFTLPDHRVTKIAGASYEGFYYICYDKSKGVIEGYYYSKDSEPNQYINLKMIKKYSSSVFKFM